LQSVIDAPVRLAAALYVLVGLVVWPLSALGDHWPGDPKAAQWPFLNGPRALDGWFQMDGTWYYDIAQHGYFYTPGQQSSIAFFPTYPIAVRWVGELIGDFQLAGSLITVVCGFAFVVMFAYWVQSKVSPVTARWSVVVIALYPYFFFLHGSLYADALFLVCVLGAFIALDAGHPWVAGVLGALATAARPVGFGVLLGLAARTIELRALDGYEGSLPVPFQRMLSAIRRLRWRDIGVAVSAVGLIGWCVYLWIEFDSPLAWIDVQSAPGWNQGSGPKTWFKVTFFGTMVKGPPHIIVLLIPQAIVSVLAVLLIRRTWRVLGWGYSAYATGILLIAILGTKDFMGDGRYVLSAFPVFVAGGHVLAANPRRWLGPTVATVSFVGLCVAAFFFARGFEVS
jgi:hypothetical protein